MWLVRPAKEFKDVSEIIGYLSSIGLDPVGYHELLEFAIQKPKLVAKGETVYALGSPAALPSGSISWQCYGVNDAGRFLSDVVQGDSWSADSFYLAKGKLAK